jgi:uncharacterized membrane protein YfcA
MLSLDNFVITVAAALLHMLITSVAFVIVAQHVRTWSVWRRGSWALLCMSSAMVFLSISVTLLVDEPQWISYERAHWQELFLAAAVLCLAINTWYATRGAAAQASAQPEDSDDANRDRRRAWLRQ